MLNKKILTVLSVLITVSSLLGLATNANAVNRDDPYSTNFKRGQANYIKPNGPPQLVLRTSFDTLKASCIRAAGTIATHYDIDFDGSSRDACGCIASHAQVSGVPDKIATEVAGHMDSGNIRFTTAKRYKAYENVLEYCLADEMDD